MSLVALTHRRLASITAAGLTMPQVLDAIWTGVAPTVTTYSDGSNRVFSGSSATGWTWTLVQVSGVTEALYATPPGGSLAQRVIVAGRSAAPTPSPVMLAPETFGNSIFMIGHALSAGAFTTWNASSPFTSGRWSGYTRMGAAVTGFTSPIVMTVYESQEDIVVELLAGGTAVMVCGAGAYVDPESTDPADMETDGRRYGVWTAGTTLVSNMLGSAATGTVFLHSAAQGPNAHTYVWRPGTATIDGGGRYWNSPGNVTVANLTTLSGKNVGTPIQVTNASGWAGRIREKTFIRGMLHHQIISNGGVIQGYAMAPSTTATGDCILMRY